MAVMRIGNRALHYSDQGPKDGHALVFSNSLGTDFRIWDALLPLLPKGFRLIRYDKAGHGLSDYAGERPIEDHAGDLAALLDHLAVKNAVIVGLSIGGLIAQALAVARPDLARAIVLMDTGSKIGTAAMWQERIDTVKQGGIEALADGTMQRWFAPSFHENRSDEMALWRNMLTRTLPAGYIACCAAIRDADLSEGTKTIKLPTLCLVGAHDGATTPELVQALAGLIDGAGFVVIDDAGHLPCIEQPKTVAAAINGLLDQVGLV
ncbi:MAG: 3-oxoadipate enol-lactonase [Geminicoccaceae bacterium]